MEIEKPEKLRAWLKTGLVAFVASTFVGLVYGLRYYLVSVSDPRIVFSFSNFVWIVAGWWMWVILSPLVIFLARRFRVDRHSWKRTVPIHAGAWVIVFLIDVTLFFLFRLGINLLIGRPVAVLMMEYRLSLIASLVFDLLVYSAIVATVHAYDFYQQYRERELSASRLQAQLSRAKLQALEQQLHPHFLFNTLHAMSALVVEDPPAAQRMITLLGELLRMTLDRVDENEVTLREELAFIDRYIEIQRIRFRGEFEAYTDVRPEVLDACVPRLILQPIVENAIKHGTSVSGGQSRVRIRAFKDGDNLVLRVEDDGPGFEGKFDPNEHGTGLGLRNTRERLEALYGDAFALELSSPGKGGAVVSLNIPFYTVVDKYDVVEDFA